MKSLVDVEYDGCVLRMGYHGKRTIVHALEVARDRFKENAKVLGEMGGEQQAADCQAVLDAIARGRD